ncbi:MAG TPA: AAA family ATPase [Woeseiaceae bacterium]|nr:AAA family ATPase [Woeseiaceae bacterium]
MNRSVISDAAVSAAKGYSHGAVEPRHVLFALARHFRERPECAGFLEPARRGLEPRGNSYGSPAMSEAATALIGTLNSDDDGIAALRQAFEGDGTPSAAGAAGGQAAETAEEAAPRAQPQAASAAAESVADVLAELDALTGLNAVKAQVRRIIAVVQANTEREKAGLRPVKPGLHLVFTGPPGTGKTTVARLVARLYAAAGALPGSNFTEATRADLIAGYVGQTAIKTHELINRTRPGVLFIDEAYSLTPTSGVDFGHEAIATLVKAMEDHRNDFAVIVAGYGDEMQEFIECNPGLRSRFKTFIDFPDYSSGELSEIFGRMAHEVGIALGPGALEKAAEVFAAASGKRSFGNARFARSLFEQAYARMATRAADDGAVTIEELTTLLAEDIDDDLSMLPSDPRRIGF